MISYIFKFNFIYISQSPNPTNNHSNVTTFDCMMHYLKFSKKMIYLLTIETLYKYLCRKMIFLSPKGYKYEY